MSALIWILGPLLFLWLGAMVYLWRVQEVKLFPCNGTPFGPNAGISALGGTPERVSREGQDLRFHLVPAKGPLRGWLLVFHGNSGGADERADYAVELSPLGLNVVLAEFPGYAPQAGAPRPPASQVGEWPILRNALAMADEVGARRGTLPLFILGESMGTGPSTYVAGRREARGLVLHTPYTSMSAVAAARYPWMPVKRLIRHPFNARLWAPHVTCPVLVLHGTADPTVPYKLGVAQSKNFRVPPKFVTVEGAEHNNLRDFDKEAYWGSIRAFIQGLL